MLEQSRKSCLWAVTSDGQISLHQKFFARTFSSAFGCFVEVDIAYPTKIHDVDNDLPLALVKSKKRTEWRSGYNSSFGLNVEFSTEKLEKTLLDKAD